MVRDVVSRSVIFRPLLSFLHGLNKPGVSFVPEHLGLHLVLFMARAGDLGEAVVLGV